MNLLPAIGVSLGVALIAWRGRALTLSGALTAALLGTLTLASTGWAGAIVLGSFFLPSTLIGRIGAGTGSAEIRTAAQVLANGGPGMLGSTLALWSPATGLWILACSLAAASADTWATSTGRWSRRNPVLFGTRQRVEPGTSGGVTLVGSIGGLVGAFIVSAAGALAGKDLALLPAACIIGWSGMFLDSGLGAWLQARYACPRCRVTTEERRHLCGTRTVRERGLGWLDNNGVNLLITLTAALAGAAASLL